MTQDATKDDDQLEVLLLHGNSYDNADIYYATGFLASEELIYIRSGETDLLVTSEMEKERAEEESGVDSVLSRQDLRDETDPEGSKREAELIKRAIRCLADEAKKVKVSDGFASGIYEKLSEDYRTRTVKSPFEGPRAVKKVQEVKEIRAAQVAASEAVKKVRDVLMDAEVSGNCVVRGDDILTQGSLKKTVLHELVGRGFGCRDLIVSSGEESAFPHKRGEDEKTLSPGEPIIVDVFPRNRKSRYCGDITRTFVKGRVDEKLVDLHEAVEEAQRRALDSLKPGVKASEIDKAVRTFFEERGYCSEGKGKDVAHMKHSTGHGIGLEVHEAPRLSMTNDIELKEGNVVAVEPGLYKKELGGVRIEDVAVVKEGGAEVLCDMGRNLLV